MTEDFKFRVLTGADWALYQDPALTGKDGVLQLADEPQPYREGEFVSPPLDSGVDGCHWHRLALDAAIPENAQISLSCFPSATGELPASWPPETVFKNARDALAPDGPGRYLRVRIRLRREGTESPGLRTLRVYYPRLSYLRYLPAVYGQDDGGAPFLEQFLSVFETPLSGLEETITDGPRFFDPLAAPVEFVPWLAGWLSLELYELLGDKNREFILRAMEFYKRKGTPAGLASLVSFLTGKRCCVKEYMNNVFRSYGMEHLEGPVYDEFACSSGVRAASRTVDTADAQMVSALGTHLDSLHYVTDTGGAGRYAHHVVGVFIFLSEREKAFVIDKTKLLKIIKSFLPVHVRVDIVLVEEIEEIYPAYGVTDEYDEVLERAIEERVGGVAGVYEDAASWETFISLRADGSGGTTNDPGHRTPYPVLTKEQPA